MRYADGEYAAEQPQGLPAVIAELTRWAAQNLEQPLKSEINVGSRLSEKGRRLKRRITKCNTTRANQASLIKCILGLESVPPYHASRRKGGNLW